MKTSFRDRMMNILQAIRGGSKRVIYNNVSGRPPQRKSQDIASWRKAIKYAEGHGQQRSQLYDLYEDVLLDGYLSAAWQKRLDQVTNRELVFVDAEGNVNEEVTALARTSYFEDLLIEMMNAKAWGHSLLELYWPAPGEEVPGETILIPRKNVKSRFGIVTEEYFDLEGIDYRKKPYADQILEVGKPEELGLLGRVAQYVIFKRGNFGDWAQYQEVFGTPFRWVTYNNPQSREVLEQAMEDAGSAGYVVAPEDASMQYFNGNISGQGGEGFRQLRNACNEEIGLTVLGNTMTTIEAKSSGYAQSKTQAAGENEVNLSDRRYVLRQLNEKIVVYLKRRGYQVDGFHWDYREEDHLTTAQRADMISKLSQIAPIPASYIYETFNIPPPTPEELKEMAPAPASAPPEDDPEGEPAPKEEKTPTPGKLNARAGSGSGNTRTQAISLHYDHGHGCNCGACIQLADNPLPNFRRIARSLEDKIAEAVRTGRLTTAGTSAELHRQYYKRLMSSARTGYTRSLSDYLDWEDFELQQGLKRNLSEFATMKQNALIEELSALPRTSQSDYKKAARRVFGRYHDRYLKTEMLTVESAAHTAGAWREYLDNAEFFPNLKFTTSGDDRVREKHALLDGAVYPINHPFWATHTPPLDYLCRCALLQTDEPTSERDGLEIRPGFGANPFDSKALIQRDHPYFQVPKHTQDVLLDTAERLRADIELKGVTKRARTQDQTVYNQSELGDVIMPREFIDEILESATAGRGVRNALLSEVQLLLSQMTAINGPGSIFHVSVLDYTFAVTFEATDTGIYELTKIVAI